VARTLPRSPGEVHDAAGEAQRRGVHIFGGAVFARQPEAGEHVVVIADRRRVEVEQRDQRLPPARDRRSRVQRREQ
jgi:hypothetical protein